MAAQDLKSLAAATKALLLQEMNMRTVNFLIGTLLALAAAAAYAQAGSEPCKADFEKYCPGVKPGGGAVNACVKEHGSRFSPACN